MMVLRYAYLAGPGVNCVGAHNGEGLELRLLVIYKITIVYRLYLVLHRVVVGLFFYKVSYKPM